MKKGNYMMCYLMYANVCISNIQTKREYSKSKGFGSFTIPFTLDDSVFVCKLHCSSYNKHLIVSNSTLEF